MGKVAVLACGCALLAGCQAERRGVVHTVAVDAVVAKVNGSPIHRSDVDREAAQRGLDAPAPGSAAYAGLVDQLIDQKLLADEAVNRGLDTSPAGRRRLETARERVLADMMLEDKLRGATTPTAVAGLYDEMVRARPAGSPPPEPLAFASPRIIRFLTYDRVKDLVLDLRHRAKIEVMRQAPAAPAPVGAAKP